MEKIQTSKTRLAVRFVSILPQASVCWILLFFLGTWIVADMDIPPVEKLIIWGVLEMEDKSEMGAAGPSYRRVVLNATYISVQVRMRSSNLYY